MVAHELPDDPFCFGQAELLAGVGAHLAGQQLDAFLEAVTGNQLGRPPCSVAPADVTVPGQRAIKQGMRTLELPIGHHPHSRAVTPLEPARVIKPFASQPPQSG